MDWYISKQELERGIPTRKIQALLQEGSLAPSRGHLTFGLAGWTPIRKLWEPRLCFLILVRGARSSSSPSYLN